MGYHSCVSNIVMPLIRPKLLIETARIGARSYQRERDLAGAVAGLAGRAAKQILARLTEAERVCEDLRRARSPAYRPAKHVQILSALIAESGRDPGQTKASGSDALRLSI